MTLHRDLLLLVTLHRGLRGHDLRGGLVRDGLDDLDLCRIASVAHSLTVQHSKSSKMSGFSIEPTGICVARARLAAGLSASDHKLDNREKLRSREGRFEFDRINY